MQTLAPHFEQAVHSLKGAKHVADIRNFGLAAGITIAVPPVSAAIDPALIGEWELLEVEELGAIDDFGAAVDEMNVEFSVDGGAHVMLEIEQDQDTMERERTFRFTTLDGRIVPDQGAPVAYEILGQDDIRLTTPDGLVVHLHRAAADVSQL